MISRALQLISERPQRLLSAFTIEGWRKFFGLRRERRKTAEGEAAIRARHVAQAEAFRSKQWSHQGAVSQRVYASYDDYRAHQAEKLDNVGGEAWGNKDKAVAMFRRRFEGVFPADGKVVCLAARRGEEVKALRELGCDAIGIDLNPGKDNPLVIPGDFHNLQFTDGSFDAVYTNSLDHAFDLKKVTGEVSRVLKPGGLFVVDIVIGYEEGYAVGPHDAMHWPTARGFAELLARESGLMLTGFRDLAPVGTRDWTQAVLTKK